MPDYIGNWIKMLMGAKMVDPQTPTPGGMAASASAPSAGAAGMPPNPVTGAPRAANYGQDVELPMAGGPLDAAIQHFKTMGYPEAVAVKLALQQQHAGGGGMGAAMGGMAAKMRRE